MEEEAYAQAKEEKEEDEGTFQVDYMLQLSTTFSSWHDYPSTDWNVPRDVFKIFPGFVSRLSPVWSVHSGS